MGKGNGRMHNDARTARSGGALLATRVRGRLYNDNGNANVYEIGPIISVSLFKNGGVFLKPSAVTFQSAYGLCIIHVLLLEVVYIEITPCGFGFKLR